MSESIVTVFGGTGFLGRRVVQAVANAGYKVRVAARRPDAVDFIDTSQRLMPFTVDIRDEASVREAVAGSAAVINAVSLYVEKGDLTFDAIHVKGAERIARCARLAKVERLIHVSGIGVDERSTSKFVQARARGEQAVRDAFERVTLVRPSVMFGRDDAFLTSLERVTRLPLVPLFGQGKSRMQPAWVNDVAAALAHLSGEPIDGSKREFKEETSEFKEEASQTDIFELGGAKIYTYRQAVKVVMSHLGRKKSLVSVPFSVWHALVAMLHLLPNPPLTRDQLMLLESDNVVNSAMKTFADLGMQPHKLEEALDTCFPGAHQLIGEGNNLICHYQINQKFILIRRK